MTIDQPTGTSPTRPFLTNNPSASNNPSSTLSIRVSKVLATHQFDDPNTRLALDTLDRLNNNRSNDRNVDDDDGGGGDLEQNLDDYGSDLQNLKRGGLRRILEARMRNRSRQFLNVFSQLNDKFIELQSNLDQMHKCCDEVENQLNLSDSGTKFLLQHADGLRRESQSIATKQLIAKAFLHRFTLSDTEVQALTSREIHVNRDLFSAIDHCHQIRSDCAILLAGDTTETQTTQKAGLDIMQSTSKYLDKAYDKVARWTLLECRSGLIKVEDSQAEVNPLMKKAMNCLKSRPELLDEALSILSTSRSTSLLNSFLDALTRGGPSGLPRPIELNAHDPIRYVGDMLAWVHQVMASEHEFLESLFDLQTGKRRLGQSRVFSTSTSNNDKSQSEAENASIRDEKSEDEKTIVNLEVVDDHDRVLKMLDRNLEGCTRPLKIRVLQTIKSQESSLVAYQLTSLLEFYKTTMASTIGPDSKLTQALKDITAESYENFYRLLKSLTSPLINMIEHPQQNQHQNSFSSDLSIPSSLNESMSNLKELIKIYESSLRDYPMERSFEKVLELVIEPILDFIEDKIGFDNDNSNRKEKTLDEGRFRFKNDWDRKIFLVNCEEFILDTLGNFEFTRSTFEKVKVKLDQNVQDLIKEHHENLLSLTGLRPIIEIIKTKDPEIPLSRIENADAKSISMGIKSFEDFLMNLDPLDSRSLRFLRSTGISSKIHRDGLNLIFKDYENLFDSVNDSFNRFEFVSMILIRSKDEVKTLIGC